MSLRKYTHDHRGMTDICKRCKTGIENYYDPKRKLCQLCVFDDGEWDEDEEEEIQVENTLRDVQPDEELISDDEAGLHPLE